LFREGMSEMPRFFALPDAATAALDRFHVGPLEEDQFPGALAPIKKDIVEKRGS